MAVVCAFDYGGVFSVRVTPSARSKVRGKVRCRARVSVRIEVRIAVMPNISWHGLHKDCRPKLGVS